MGRSRWGVLGSIGFAALACTPLAKPIEDVPDILPSAEPPPAAPSAAPRPAEEAPETSQIRRLAKDLENCRPEPSGDYENCTESEEWSKHAREWFEKGRHDALLVELLQSDHAALRFAVAQALAYCDGCLTNKALASQIMGVMEKEQDTQVGPELVRWLQVVDFQSVGLLDRAHAMVTKHSNRALHLALISEAGLIPETAPILLEAFDAADLELKRAIVRGVFLGEEESACAVYKKALGSADDEMSDTAVGAISTTNRCQDLLAPALAWIAKVKEPPAESSLGEDIGNLCAWKSDARQHAQLLAQAKRLAMKGRTEIRSGALKSVMRCDPKFGPGFVRAFTKDKDEKVAEAARKLIAEPPGPAHVDVL